MNNNSRVGLLLLFFVLSAAHWVSAQTAASISGTVRDPQGRAIAGAAVTIFARGAYALGSTTADAQGGYRFDFLPAGDYIIQAEAPQFDRFVTQEVHVDRSAVTLDLPLQVAALRQQVVVTASTTPQTPDEVSKAVTVVGRQDIEQRDEFAISEVLRATPGLRLNQLGGPGAFTTIQLRGLRSQDTAVLIDGLRFRDASATQADASGLLEDMLVTNVDHIEILRGSGSSLYGTNAIGGVINVITDEGGGRTRGSILEEGGSLGLFRGKAQLAGGLKDNRVQYSLGLAYLNVSSGVDGDDPARNTSGQGRISIRLAPGTQLIARFYGADSFVKLNTSPTTVGNLPPAGIIEAIPLSLSELYRYEAGTPISQLAVGNATFIPSANDSDNTRAARFLSGALILSGRSSPALGYSLSYQGLATNRMFGSGPAGVGFQPVGGIRSDFNGRIQTLNARIDYQLGRFNLISSGYEFEDENFTSLSLDRLNPAATSTADVTQRSNTFFVQDQARLFGDRVEVSGAFRVQAFSLQHPKFTPIARAPFGNVTFTSPPTAYTGDVSVAYFLRQTGTKIRAHVGRGYRSPSLFERFGAGFDPDFGYSVYGDPRLHPERSIAADGGIDQSFFSQRLRTSATYFYTRLHDVIIFDFSGAINPATDPFGRIGGYRNTKGGLARGVEVSSLISANRSLDISVAYTYTNSLQRTPIIGGILRSFRIPAHQVSVVTTQRLGERLFVTLDFTASSNYLAQIFGRASRAYRFDGIKKADLGLSYRIPLREFKAVRFFAKIDNLFNQTYYESGFRTPGATGVGGLQFEF
ncbi:MAG: TonB-dependent receptor [Acidobacteria bacterium]|nr:TonB-dependent receptor [Acidobacteriota bacterium]